MSCTFDRGALAQKMRAAVQFLLNVALYEAYDDDPAAMLLSLE